MKVVLFANTDWYLYNFRLPLAESLRRSNMEVVLMSPPGEYASRLEAIGFRWIPFPLSRRGLNPFFELGTIIHLLGVYRRERPDLLHHFTHKCVLYGSLAGRLAGVRVIVNSVTGLGYLFIGNGLLRRILRAVIRVLYRLILGNTQVIFQNEDDRNEFLSRKMIRPGRSHLIPGSGVDVSSFLVTPEPGGEPVVVLAARMLWDKGVGEFVEAARLLHEQGVSARFVLVGEPYVDNPAAIPAAQLEDWKREGSVEWWGWREDMPAVYSGANIVCLPSYREGIPRSLIEASACARAVVASDVPGCRQAVRHGKNGLLVPVRDVNELARALKKLIGAPELRHRMGAYGRRLVEKEFSSEKIVRATLAVYRCAGLDNLDLQGS